MLSRQQEKEKFNSIQTQLELFSNFVYNNDLLPNIDIIKTMILEIYLSDWRQFISERLKTYLSFLLTNFSDIESQFKFRLNEITKQRQAVFHFCFALILQLLKIQEPKDQYQNAYNCDPQNPEICLYFAWYLYPQNPKSAVEYIDKIIIEKAIQDEYRQSIKDLLEIRLLKEYSIICKNLIKKVGNIDYLLVIRSCYEFALDFLLDMAQQNSNKHQLHYSYWLDLGFAYLSLERLTEAAKWADQIKQIKSNSVTNLLRIGKFYENICKYDECIKAYQQAILINPKCQYAYQRLIYYARRFNQGQKWKQYINKLIKLNKYNSFSYFNIGMMKHDNKNYEQAIKWLSFAIKCDLNSTIEYKLLAESLYHLGRKQQAKKMCFYSIKQHPQTWDYDQFGACYQVIGQKISSINCYQKAIIENQRLLGPFIRLAHFALQNDYFKNQINKFIEQKVRKIISEPPKNQFGIALYYYLTKQSYSQFHKIILVFHQERNSQNKKNVYSDFIIGALRQYNRCKRQYRSQNTIALIIIGIFCREIQSYTQAHQCFTTLFNKYKTNYLQSYVQIFNLIYEEELKESYQQSLPLFLEFILIEMVKQSPNEALQCYYMSRKLHENPYTNFQIQLNKKCKEDIKDICYLFQLIEFSKNVYQILAQIAKVSWAKSIFNLKYFGLILSNFQYILNEQGELNFQNFAILANFSSRQSQLFLKLLYNGLMWSEHIPGDESCSGLYLQISKQQKKAKDQVEEYSKNIINTSVCTLQSIEVYFKRTILINQAIKFLYNSLYPFLFNNQSIHFYFSQILYKIKNHNNYKNQQLKSDLQNLLYYRIQDSVRQQQQNQINEPVSFSTDNMLDEIWEQPDKQLETQSQYDLKQSLAFQEFPIVRNRRYSDSNSLKINTIEYQLFIEELDERKNINSFNVQVSQKGNTQEYHQPSSSQEDNQSSHQQSDLILLQPKQSEPYQISSISRYSLNRQELFHKNYTRDDIKFLNRRRYFQFKQICFKNTYYIIRQIYKNGNKAKHIAKHYLFRQFQAQKIQILVEKGNKVFLPPLYNSNVPETRHFRQILYMGASHIFQWIADISLVISQLEQLGIYHSDLGFRNTIVVGSQNAFIYKVIDFDKAYKTIKSVEIDIPYECTKQLISFWLNFKISLHKSSQQKENSLSISNEESFSTNQNYSQQDIINYIYVDADENLRSQLIEIKSNQELYSDRLEQCLKLLWLHMKSCHLQQFSKLVERLMEGDNSISMEKVEEIPQKKKKQILNELEKLNNQQIDYKEFSNMIKEIHKCQIPKDHDQNV